jgi:serine/threonine protein kinase
MASHMVSEGPASWPGGGGFATKGRVISSFRMPSACGASSMVQPKFDRGANGRSLLPIGTILQGKYRLDRLLGVGAMASVFAATHLRNVNCVAVKILHPDLAGNSEIRTRFLQEGYAANSVRHAGTVRVFDDHTAEEGEVAFFVMELLEGETLESLWERCGRRLPPREVAQLMCQLLDVLAAAHEKGIIHRDIKPENLFIEADGTLRVLDFGVARVLEGSFVETRTGSLIGTLPYMAPEQMLGKVHEVDARSDVWAVGATAFTLVSGSFVHEAETPEEMLVFTASRQAPSLARVAPHAPRAFIHAVDRALRFDKSERWPSARTMQSALAEACATTRADEGVLDGGGQSSRQFTAQEELGIELRERPSAVAVATGSHVGARWTLVAAAVLVIAAAFVVPPANRRSPAPPLANLVQPAAPFPPSISRVAVLGEATTDSVRAAASAQDTPPREVVAAPIDGIVAPLGRTQAVREASKAVAAPSLAPTRRMAALGSSELPRPTVAPPAPDGCAPPYAIAAGTGKKIWKRECL